MKTIDHLHKFMELWDPVEGALERLWTADDQRIQSLEWGAGSDGFHVYDLEGTGTDEAEYYFLDQIQETFEGDPADVLYFFEWWKRVDEAVRSHWTERSSDTELEMTGWEVAKVETARGIHIRYNDGSREQGFWPDLSQLTDRIDANPKTLSNEDANLKTQSDMNDMIMHLDEVRDNIQWTSEARIDEFDGAFEDLCRAFDKLDNVLRHFVRVRGERITGKGCRILAVGPDPGYAMGTLIDEWIEQTSLEEDEEDNWRATYTVADGPTIEAEGYYVTGGCVVTSWNVTENDQ